MRKLISFILILALSLCLAGAQAEQETGDLPDGMLSGGWAVAEDNTITDELQNKFWQAMDSYQTGMITVSYTPVAFLGTQVVAGTNYAILCRAQEINQERILVIVYLYEDLDGNVSVLDITDLALGI